MLAVPYGYKIHHNKNIVNNFYKKHLILLKLLNIMHIRDVNAAINLKMNAIKTVGQGVSEFRSVEGVEDLATLALQIGASDEAENLTGDGQNVLTLL